MPGSALPDAAAGILAPGRASDLRTVVGTDTSPVCPGGPVNSRLVDTQQTYDGTTAAFSVPLGSVFVVTSWEWLCVGSPSSTANIVLNVKSGTGMSLVSSDLRPTDGNGIATGLLTTLPGAAVKGGGPFLCFSAGNCTGLTVVTVRGFMAKDK